MMNSEAWKTTSYASCFAQTGLTHQKGMLPCEDITVVREQTDLLFYGLADGQSGKTHCRQGGEAVLNAVADYLAQRGIHTLSQYEHKDEIQYEIIRIVRETLSGLAAANRAETAEFSSTLLAFGITPETGEYMTVHLGDGGIVGRRADGTLTFLSAPENGITSRYTWLTTSEEALLHLRIGFGSIAHYTRVILLTDGADAVCRGTNLTAEARRILGEEDDASRIPELIRNSRPLDDASCIVVDCEKQQKSTERPVEID
jgi:hypothetical protein